MKKNYEIIFDSDDENDYRIYLIKKQRCHHKNGWKAIQGERIAPENLPKKTLLSLIAKGLAKRQKEVLP